MSGLFDGLTAVVTGASSGIGAEVCRQMHEAGAHVFGLDRQPPSDAVPWQVESIDVSDERVWTSVIDRILAEAGRIDVLVNNAGIGSTTSVVDCTVEEWDRVMAVNARGVFLGIRAVLPSMLAAGSGSIVNTASVLGLIGAVDRAAYGASKGAVIALTKQVAIQYVDRGLRCNAVAPGTVDSPWVARLLENAENPGAMRERLIARQPIGRLAEPEEVAAAAVYLASPAASFITGTVLTIDGGITAGIR